jgi:methylmalonyl-CoA mutase C-terminal domain/subunit
VLVAKPGLDGHDRGAKVVARGLRDAGMEVIYSGLHRTPAQIVRTALDEDVQVVGLSILSGAHNRLLPEVVSGLADEGLDDVLVIAGGIIPARDAQALRATGIGGVFPPGTPIAEIVAFIEERVQLPGE